MSGEYRSVISHGFMTMGSSSLFMRGLNVQEIQTDVCQADINEKIYIVEITSHPNITVKNGYYGNYKVLASNDNL